MPVRVALGCASICYAWWAFATISDHMLRHFLQESFDAEALGSVGNGIYYALIVVALVVGSAMIYVRLAELGIGTRQARNVALFCLITSYPLGIVASRAVNVFYTPRETWGVAAWWAQFLNGGTHTYHAALALPLAAWTLYIARSGIGVWRGLDVIMLNIPLGHAFGRLGCLFAGCCFGGEVDWHLGPLHYDYRNPAPLYELVGNLVIHAALLRLYRRVYFGPSPGQAAGLLTGGYLVMYGVLRFVLETIRTEPVVGLGLTQAQLVMCAAIVSGLAVLVGTRARSRAAARATGHGR